MKEDTEKIETEEEKLYAESWEMNELFWIFSQLDLDSCYYEVEDDIKTPSRK